MSEFRVGLIGFGLAGATFHAPLIAATPGLRLSAIVTRDAERRRVARRDYPEARLVATVEELLAPAKGLDSTDLVVVASPNALHAEHALAALQAGRSVVVDKPFATSLADAERIVEEAERRELLAVPFHNRRWDGDFLTLRRLIAEDRLGPIVRLESRFERWRVVPKPRWMEMDAVANGEGIIYDLHSHLIDQALVLFGPVVSVYAEAARRRAGVQTDDDAFVALTHASGVRSHLKATIVAADIGPRFRAYGERGAYVKLGVDPQEEMLKAGHRPGDAGFGEEPPERWGVVSDGQAVAPVRAERGTYVSFYAGLVDALRGEAPPPVDARDAVAGLRVIAAAYRSVGERRIVEIGS